MSQYRENDENLAWILSALNNMIDESMYHTRTFAHALKSHGNDKAAEVFFLAFEQFSTQKEIVAEHAEEHDLPVIPPWETLFPEYMHPSTHLTDAHYLMTEEEARKIAGVLIGSHSTVYDCLIKENRAEEVIGCVVLLMKHQEEWR